MTGVIGAKLFYSAITRPLTHIFHNTLTIMEYQDEL